MSKLEDRREAREGLKALAGRAPVVAALDIGATKVSCFIMKQGGVNREMRTLQTAGVGYVQSRGVRGGSIVNMDEATDAVAQAVERAEAVAGVSVQGVAVTTSGGQLASHRLASEVALGPRPIADVDLSRAISTALGQVKMPGRRPIHLLPIAWSVDAQRGVRDPRSMFGKALRLGPDGRLDERGDVPDPRLLRRAGAPGVRRRGRRSLRLGARRARGRRDGPWLHLHRHGRRLDLGGRVRRRLAGARRQSGRRRRACDRRHRPRPLHLHRRRRAHQDPARLGHRLGQRRSRDDRGAAARR